MKDCENCERFGGYDEDGCPQCEPFENGEPCPYNDEAEVKNFGMTMQIDTEKFTTYIAETMRNTASSAAHAVINQIIKDIVTETYKEEIQKKTRDAMASIIDQQIRGFMDKPITIGGGWREPERTLSREDYLTECIQECLKTVDDKKIKSMAEESVKSYVVDFSRKLKDGINRDVKGLFDEATRQTLTASVVDMLMTNDTYQKLSRSMGALLPEKGR